VTHSNDISFLKK